MSPSSAPTRGTTWRAGPRTALASVVGQYVLGRPAGGPAPRPGRVAGVRGAGLPVPPRPARRRDPRRGRRPRAARRPRAWRPGRWTRRRPTSARPWPPGAGTRPRPPTGAGSISTAGPGRRGPGLDRIRAPADPAAEHRVTGPVAPYDNGVGGGRAAKRSPGFCESPPCPTWSAWPSPARPVRSPTPSSPGSPPARCSARTPRSSCNCSKSPGRSTRRRWTPSKGWRWSWRTAPSRPCKVDRRHRRREQGVRRVQLRPARRRRPARAGDGAEGPAHEERPDLRQARARRWRRRRRRTSAS